MPGIELLFTGPTENVAQRILNETIVTSGLTMHLDAGRTSSYPGTGTTWTDLAGNSNNGSFVNNVTFSRANGGILQLNPGSPLSSSAYIDFPSNVNTRLANAVQTFSIAIKIRSFNQVNNGIQSIWHATQDTSRGHGILFRTDSIPFATLGSGGLLNGRVFVTNPLGVWAEFTSIINYTAGTHTLYKNGLLVGSVAIEPTGFDPRVPPYDYSTTITIGWWNTTGNPEDRMDAEISYVRLYNRGLSLPEIQTNYNTSRWRFGLPEAT
jgi:hypothetical protein